MKLTTYFRAMEKACFYANSEITAPPYECVRKMAQVHHLRSGLICRMERVELDNAILRGSLPKFDTVDEMMADLEDE